MVGTPEITPAQTRNFARWWLGALAAVLVGAIAVLYVYNPTQHSFYPRCFFHAMTGLDCPGCGGLRATHELLHGNLQAAFQYNPLLVCFAPAAALFFVWQWRAKVRAKPRSRLLENTKFIWTVASIVVVFTVLRNLPWHTFFTGE
jgi:hypothetical protein